MLGVGWWLGGGWRVAGGERARRHDGKGVGLCVVVGGRWVRVDVGGEEWMLVVGREQMRI